MQWVQVVRCRLQCARAFQPEPTASGIRPRAHQADAEERQMERFDVDWQAVKLSLCTGASGAVIGAYLLVQVFGYVDPARVRPVAGAREAAYYVTCPQMRQRV